MVIPLIFGSMIKSFLEMETNSIQLNSSIMLMGFLAAFITGIIACKWMIEWVKNSKLWYFSIYCMIAGTAAIIFGIL